MTPCPRAPRRAPRGSGHGLARVDVVKSTGDGLMAVFALDARRGRGGRRRPAGLARGAVAGAGALRVRIGIHAGEVGGRGRRLLRADRQPDGADHVRRSRRPDPALVVGRGSLVGERPAGDRSSCGTSASTGSRTSAAPSTSSRSRTPALPADFPPLSTLARRPNNLPTQASVFVGRDTEIGRHPRPAGRSIRATADARRTGRHGQDAARPARRRGADRGRFTDGVFFVDLAPMRDTDAMLAATARAVGLAESSDRPLLEEL